MKIVGTCRLQAGFCGVLCALVSVSLFAGEARAEEGKESRGCGAAERYRIVPIPLRPYHVNDEGVVAGMTEDHRAGMWTATEGLKTIELPAGFHHAEGVDVNAHGELLGTASTADGGRRQSFVYADGKLTLVAGEGAKAAAINANGDLAGEAKLAGSASTGPVLWREGKQFALGACCGGRATALNDRRVVAGEAYDKQGRYQAFVWNEKAGLRLIGPAETYSTAAAINEHGHVVVYAFTEGSSLYRDGVLTKMELSKRWPSQPRAINGCDVVVGSFGSNSDESEGFRWDEKGGFRNLNDFIPQNSGWNLEFATSVNERGEIAGWGDHGGEEDAGFLLVPER